MTKRKEISSLRGVGSNVVKSVLKLGMVCYNESGDKELTVKMNRTWRRNPAIVERCAGREHTGRNRRLHW